MSYYDMLDAKSRLGEAPWDKAMFEYECDNPLLADFLKVVQPGPQHLEELNLLALRLEQVNQDFIKYLAMFEWECGNEFTPVYFGSEFPNRLTGLLSLGLCGAPTLLGRPK